MSDKGTKAKEDRGAAWTPDQREKLRKIASRIQAERPSPAQLIASGEYDGPLPFGVYQDYVLVMHELRCVREELGLSLADAAERCGIDKGSICKLESGQTNPTFQTIGRYASSIGKRVKLVLEDLSPQDPVTDASPVLVP